MLHTHSFIYHCCCVVFVIDSIIKEHKNRWIMASILSCIQILHIHNVVRPTGALGVSRKYLAPCSVIVEDFKTSNICLDSCVYYDTCDAPTSVVIINQSNGSRTIIHSNNNLPELTLDDFKKLDLSQYSWIHFEASSLACTVSVMQQPNMCLTSSDRVQNTVAHFIVIHVNVSLSFPFFSFLTKSFPNKQFEYWSCFHQMTCISSWL